MQSRHLCDKYMILLLLKVYVTHYCILLALSFLISDYIEIQTFLFLPQFFFVNFSIYFIFLSKSV